MLLQLSFYGSITIQNFNFIDNICGVRLCDEVSISCRYAEKIFWSIEAVLAETDEKRRENLQFATAPRTIEFYFFLQAFLQGIPQIMLQVHILMRFTNLLELQTGTIALHFS